MARWRASVAAALGLCALGATATGLYVLVLRGAVTIDLGVGRRTRPLGPVRQQIGAPRETAFDVIAAPYLGRTPRAMSTKLRVVERNGDMVLAEHRTAVAGGLTAVTLETVAFHRPDRVDFRLVRGPVPLVTETFDLRETTAGSELIYTGEMSTDLWMLGRWWGDRVAPAWERTVATSLQSIATEAERRHSVGPKLGG